MIREICKDEMFLSQKAEPATPDDLTVAAEFRMSLNAEGLPGYYDILHPCFTVFHEDTDTFSNLWTEYCEDRHTFYSTYKKIWNDIKIVTI